MGSGLTTTKAQIKAHNVHHLRPKTLETLFEFFLLSISISSSSSAPMAMTTKLFNPETLRAAAKQSEGIHLVPLSLRRAIKKFLRGRSLSPNHLILFVLCWPDCLSWMGFREGVGAYESKGAASLPVFQPHQGDKPPARGLCLSGTRWWPNEVSWWSFWTLEDQVILWWHWFQVSGGWDCCLCGLSHARSLLRLPSGSQRGPKIAPFVLI